jgi:hypothetical protein
MTTCTYKLHGSLNVPIEHHPTIRYMVYNGYYKVMSNIPKMGQLPTPELYQATLVSFPIGPDQSLLMHISFHMSHQGMSRFWYAYRIPLASKPYKFVGNYNPGFRRARNLRFYTKKNEKHGVFLRSVRIPSSACFQQCSCFVAAYVSQNFRQSAYYQSGLHIDIYKAKEKWTPSSPDAPCMEYLPTFVQFLE